MASKLVEDTEEFLSEFVIQNLFSRMFWGQLIMYLNRYVTDGDDEVKHSWCKSIATDGKTAYINPNYALSLTPDELLFVFAHQLVHCMLGHLGRVGGRDPRLFHAAMDYYTNALLVEERIGTPPKNALIDKRFTTAMSVEEIYDILKREEFTGENFDQHLPHADEGDPGDMPTVSDDQMAAVHDRFQSAVQRLANSAGEAGTPGFVRGLMAALSNPIMDWRSRIAVSLADLVSEEYSYSHMSRRSFGTFIMPGRAPGEIAKAVIGVDLSGSMTPENQHEIMSEVKGMMMMYEHFEIIVVSFDVQVHSVKRFTEENIHEIDDFAVNMIGGGGTDFDAVWNWLKEEKIIPDQLLIFTDGYPCGSWGDPDYCPTTFIIHGSKTITAPFGATAYYQFEG